MVFRISICFFFVFNQMVLVAQQLQFMGLTEVSSAKGFEERVISTKQIGNKVVVLCKGAGYYPATLELSIIGYGGTESFTRMVAIEKDLGLTNSSAIEPIYDFDLTDDRFCVLTNKKVLVYQTDTKLSNFIKWGEYNIQELHPFQKDFTITPVFRYLHLDTGNNAIELSRCFMTSLEDAKVLILKILLHEKNVKEVLSYVSQKIPYASDVMSISSDVSHIARFANGAHAIVKNGFIPEITFLNPNLKEIATVHVPVFDPTANKPMLDNVLVATRQSTVKNTKANFNRMLGALDSSFYIHKIASIGDSILLIQCHNPQNPFLYESFIACFDANHKLIKLVKQKEYDLTTFKGKTDTLCKHNFPVFLSNLKLAGSNKYIQVLKFNCKQVVLNQSRIIDLFIRRSLEEDRFHYLITYTIE